MAQGKSDGTVYIDTRMDTNGIGKGVEETKRKLNSVTESVKRFGDNVKKSFEGTTTRKVGRSYEEVARDIKKAEAELSKLTEKQDRFLQTGGISEQITQGYKKAVNEVFRLEKTLDNAYGRLRKFEQTGKNLNSDQYKSIKYDIQSISERLKYANAELKSFEGPKYEKTRTFASMQYDVEMAKNRLASLREELARAEKTAPKSMNVLKRGVDNTTKSIKKMGNASKKSHYSIMRMLGTSLLFSIVFRAISTATQGFVDGMNNLVQYSDKANNTMSTLKSSLTQLKNSFATAFMPVITIVTPALLKLMDVIIRINTLIAQLFAALSGKNTYTKAIAVQEDYAKSLKGTAAAAKEAKSYLSGLDELTIASKEESGGGGISPGQMFEEVPVDNKVLDFIDKIRNAFDKVLKKVKELAAIFKKGFFDGLGDFQPRIDSIKKGFESIKQSLKNIFTDPDVRNSMNNFAESFAYALGQITGSIASIGLTIGANLVGGLALYLSENEDTIKEHLITMFDIGADISTMVGEWFDAIAYIFEAFASEGGLESTAGIIGIFATTFMTIQELAGSFGRDIIALLTTPIVDSKDEIKTALNELLLGFSSTIGAIKTILEDWSGFVMQFYNEVIAPVIDNLIEKLTELLQEHLVPLFSQVGEFFAVLGEVVTLFWEEILQPFIQWMIDNILPIIEPILEGMSGGFSKHFGLISDTIKFLIQALTGLLQFIKGLFYVEWDKAWEGVKNDFKEIVNGMSDILEGFINWAIGLLNDLIAKINTISSKLSFSGQGLNIPSIPEVNIPKLATGAVIPPNAPFLAMLGDQTRGTNIEAPADLIRQIVREETGGSREMMDLLTQIAQNTRETADKDLTIGDREIVKANLRGQSSMGYSLIVEG